MATLPSRPAAALANKPAIKLVFPNLHHLQQAWKKRNKSCIAVLGGMCPRFLRKSPREVQSKCKRHLRFRANSCICQYFRGSFPLTFLTSFFLFFSSLFKTPHRLKELLDLMARRRGSPSAGRHGAGPGSAPGRSGGGSGDGGKRQEAALSLRRRNAARAGCGSRIDRDPEPAYDTVQRWELKNLNPRPDSCPALQWM